MSLKWSKILVIFLSFGYLTCYNNKGKGSCKLKRKQFLEQIDSISLDNETFLCFGPMSKNSMRSLIETSENSKYPMTIIASRNQIESVKLGGGYVNGWSTESFMQEMESANSNLIFGRDHGGPFQSSRSKKFESEQEAFNDAIMSLKTDIDCGMSFLHLDPCKYSKVDVTLDGMVNSLCNMLGETYEYARSTDKDILFEIGEEGHSTVAGDAEELDYFLSKTLEFVQKNGIKKPTFCVAKLGSFVYENRNIGNFINEIRKDNLDKIVAIVSTIKKHGLRLKQHNADYLPNDILKQIPNLKIDAINIAPELGIIESTTIKNALMSEGQTDLISKLEDFVYEQNYWKKWTDSENIEKDLAFKLSAHYVFSNQQFLNLKSEAEKLIPDIDKQIQQVLKAYINNTIKCLNIWK